MASLQTLADADRRLVALWAADCAERVLPLFEAEARGDERARDGIERARAYGRGELDAAGEIRRRFEAGRAARSVTSPAAIAAARAAGQASGVAHMGAHALGAAAYAAKAVALTAPDPVAAEVARRAEVRWQIERMSADVRAALASLPLLGEDASGPLGGGLLAKGVLAETIREIQAELCADRGGSS
ncbi:putative immunity protein [Brachybacterium sp. DNPG3]